MIRSTLKRIAKRALGRVFGGDRSPAPPPPGRTTAPPPARAPEPEPEEEQIDLEIDASRVQAWLDAGEQPLFVDVRQLPEMLGGHVRDAWLMPMDRVESEGQRLPKDRPLVIYCAAGMRSYSVAGFLRQEGYDQAWSLGGGIGTWSAAGGAIATPPYRPPLTLLDPVHLTKEAAERLEQPVDDRGRGPAAVVECVDKDDQGAFSFAVRLRAGALLSGLAQEDLSPIGRRA